MPFPLFYSGGGGERRMERLFETRFLCLAEFQVEHS